MSSQKARNDRSLESTIGQFVFEHFWRVISEDAIRVFDKELQIRGVDVQVGNHRIDEKCKYYDSRTKGFMSELLQYPSFELSMVNQAGELQVGWFLKQDSLTTHYAFIQPFSTGADPKNFTLNDLDRVNLLLVKKSDLDDIKDNVDLYGESISLRDSFKETNERRRRYNGKDYWLTYSPTFHEQPVNLVLSRNHLKSLPNSKEIEILRDGTLRNIK